MVHVHLHIILPTSVPYIYVPPASHALRLILYMRIYRIRSVYSRPSSLACFEEEDYMCACVCVCIYIYIHVCVCVNLQIRTCTRSVYSRPSSLACFEEEDCVCVYIYIYMCVFV